VRHDCLHIVPFATVTENVPNQEERENAPLTLCDFLIITRQFVCVVSGSHEIGTLFKDFLHAIAVTLIHETRVVYDCKTDIIDERFIHAVRSLRVDDDIPSLVHWFGQPLSYGLIIPHFKRFVKGFSYFPHIAQKHFNLCNIFVHFARRPDLCFSELKRQSKARAALQRVKALKFFDKMKTVRLPRTVSRLKKCARCADS
jgi:hypothetical protein